MDFDYSPKTKELQAKLTQFKEDYIYPAEKDYAAEMAANTAAGKRWTPLQTVTSAQSLQSPRCCTRSAAARRPPPEAGRCCLPAPLSTRAGAAAR